MKSFEYGIYNKDLSIIKGTLHKLILFVFLVCCDVFVIEQIVPDSSDDKNNENLMCKINELNKHIPTE